MNSQTLLCFCCKWWGLKYDYYVIMTWLSFFQRRHIFFYILCTFLFRAFLFKKNPKKQSLLIKFWGILCNWSNCKAAKCLLNCIQSRGLSVSCVGTSAVLAETFRSQLCARLLFSSALKSMLQLMESATDPVIPTIPSKCEPFLLPIKPLNPHVHHHFILSFQHTHMDRHTSLSCLQMALIVVHPLTHQSTIKLWNHQGVTLAISLLHHDFYLFVCLFIWFLAFSHKSSFVFMTSTLLPASYLPVFQAAITTTNGILSNINLNPT